MWHYARSAELRMIFDSRIKFANGAQILTRALVIESTREEIDDGSSMFLGTYMACYLLQQEYIHSVVIHCAPNVSLHRLMTSSAFASRVHEITKCLLKRIPRAAICFLRRPSAYTPARQGNLVFHME